MGGVAGLGVAELQMLDCILNRESDGAGAALIETKRSERAVSVFARELLLIDGERLFAVGAFAPPVLLAGFGGLEAALQVLQ